MTAAMIDFQWEDSMMQERRSVRPAACVLFFVAFLFGAFAVQAQTPAPLSVTVPAFGTKDPTIHLVSAWDFAPVTSPQQWASTTGGYRHGNGTAQNWRAGLRLPTGVLVESISIEACDTTDVAQVEVGILECPLGGNPTQACVLIRSVFTGISAIPGCGVFSTDLTGPYTIDNQTKTNLLFASLGLDSSTSLRSVRLFYKLQVRPAPAVATFGDVPVSHPFFQFVEALAASGVTSGCSATPPAYCPDDPVTRGQMAVFISRALGLHFPF